MKLKDILHYIGLLALFITTLLGWLYWKGNDTMIVAVIIGVVLMFVVYYLVSLMVKKRKETHVNLIHVISLWVVYIAIAGFGAYLSLHSITILSLANEDLKENGNHKLEALKELKTKFIEVEREVKGQLYSDVLSYLERYNQAGDGTPLKQSFKDTLINKYGFTLTTLNNDNKMRILKKVRDNWIEINYENKIDEFWTDEIMKDLDSYHDKNKNIFDKNNILNMNKVYYELDLVLTKNKEKIENNFSELINEYDIYEDIYDDKIIPESTVSLNSLYELKKQYPAQYYIVFYLIIHLLILCPFLLTTKKGLKPKASEDNAMKL